MRSKLQVVICLSLLFLLCSLALPLPSSALTDPLTIGNYTLVGSVRSSMYEYDYTYTADIINTGPAVTAVTATLTSLSPNTKVLDGSLSFGDVPASSVKTSLDTFTIRQDRRYPFDSSKLSWTISYTPVNNPPVADAGPDQTVLVGTKVTLNGSGSSDPEGKPLSFSWTMLSRPAGSAAALSGATTVSPFFTADKPGDYVIQLIVNDGVLSSAPDTVKVSTVNSPPVAEAGPDQTVLTGALVQLNGSGSTDVNGDPLTYAWSILSKPAGSAATLSNPTIVNPTFVADKFGTYVVQLIVNDGYVSSAPDTVKISTINSPPVAEAGPDQTVVTGALVQLNGSGSTDVDGDPLTYAWSILSKPAGSAATLSNPAVVNPTFTADKFGTYIVQLIVNDGKVSSAPDTMKVTTINSPPVAEAGPDQTVLTGSVVQLNGSGSTDVDGDPLTYAWSILSKPAGSSATLSNPTIVSPTFIADKFGTYIVQLIVNDGKVGSAPDTMKVTTINSPPVAEAGPNQTVPVYTTVWLDGSKSSDPDGDPLTYAWSILSKPAGSTATLSNPGVVNPSFYVDLPGQYVVQLIVNDGMTASAPDTVTISTSNSPPVADAGPDQAGIIVGSTVQLNGSKSSDPDGDPLTYAWSILSKPAGSAAVLSSVNVVNPTFVADKRGIYVVQLIVNDGFVDSAPDTVQITTANRPPIADAGPDQTAVTVGSTVQLDGSKSSDPDSDPLTYAWSLISKPAGSAAALSAINVANPTFVADKKGSYVAQLVVSDGILSSAPDTVTITVINRPPVAEAGPDQPDKFIGTTVQLNGSGSTDPDGDALTYSWSIATRPAGSTAAILNPKTINPTFVPDKKGTYEIQLIVNDGTVDSAPDKMVVTVVNRKPVANAGPDQGGIVAGATVQLNGSASSDPDSDPLTYAWSLTTKPEGSAASLTNPNAVNPTFIADLKGTYVARLVVNDGTADSDPDTVTIAVIAAPATKISLTPSPGQMQTRSTLQMTASLDAAAGAGGKVIDIGLSSGLVTGPPTVTIPEGQLSANFSLTSGIPTGDVVVTASATGLTSGTSTISVLARDLTLTSPLVGLGRTVVAAINLALPAPAGGATFNLSVADTKVATVSPSTVTIPQGGMVGNFELTGGLSVGFTSVTADGTAGGYLSRTLEITVTNRLIDVPGGQELALGRTFTFPVLIAPDAAPPGGVEIAVTSSNPGLVEVLTPTVIVPEGAFQTTATIRASLSAVGTAMIAAANPAFAPDRMQINVTAALNLLQTISEFGQSETDTLYLRLESGGVPYLTPTPVAVNLTSSNTACVAVTSPSTVPAGDSYATATLSYGGTATLPCTATVTASEALFGTDTVQVKIGQTPNLGAITLQDITGYGKYVGSSLQVPYRVRLASASHGGVTVQIESDAPSVLLVAPNATTAGLPVIEIFIPDGQNYKDFYVQGVRGATGNATLKASSARFTAGTAPFEVVQPVFRIEGLTTSTTTLSADDEFYARAGIRYYPGGGTSWWGEQPVSGEGALPVTFTSGTPTVGRMKKTGEAGAQVTVSIPVNQSYTPTSVATGGVAFDPLTAGTTVVSATAAGFLASWPDASKTVTVTQPGMSISDLWGFQGYVGSSLQVPYRVTLGGSSHGGVTVRVESSNPAVMKVAPTATTAGTTFVELSIADGQNYKDFYVQGVRGATGDVTLTATQALFTSATFTVHVVQPVLYVTGLSTSTTTLSADDEFYAYSGIRYHPGGGTSWWSDQPVSPEGALPVTFTSGTPAVGQVKKTGEAGAQVTVSIPINQSYTPTSVATGGVAFDPLTGGTTVVSATATGFLASWPDASKTVTVSQPGMSISDLWGYQGYVGSGLQTPYRVTLGGSSHGGVVVRISSGDTTRALISPNATTAGTAFIDVSILDGQTYTDFYIQGVQGNTGSVIITASSPLFTSGTYTVQIVQPVFRIEGLPSSLSTSALDDPFYVRVGIPYYPGGGTYWWGEQPVSATGPVHAVISLTDALVAKLRTGTEYGPSVTVDVPVNATYSPTTVATGGVALDPLAAGSVTVSASSIGFKSGWPESSQVVTIVP